MTCTAQTKAGRRCRRPALAGRKLCHAHGGESVGRPAALTEEVHRRIVQLVRAGCSGEVAARAAGISPTTYYEIMRRGREAQDGPHRELFESLGQAGAEAYAHAMANWRREMATPGNWRANVAYIDRVDRGRFPLEAPASESRGQERPEVRPDLSRLSDEQLRSLEDLYVDSAEGEEDRG